MVLDTLAAMRVSQNAVAILGFEAVPQPCSHCGVVTRLSQPLALLVQDAAHAAGKRIVVLQALEKLLKFSLSGRVRHAAIDLGADTLHEVHQVHINLAARSLVGGAPLRRLVDPEPTHDIVNLLDGFNEVTSQLIRCGIRETLRGHRGSVEEDIGDAAPLHLWTLTADLQKETENQTTQRKRKQIGNWDTGN